MSIIDRNNPAKVTILERYPLTRSGSTKTTFHVTLDLENSDIHFKPGDSLGVYAQNDPSLVQQLLSAMKVTGNEEIGHQGLVLSARDFLTHKANLFRLTSNFLKLLAPYETHLNFLLQKENQKLLLDFLAAQDPLSFFKKFDLSKISVQDWCAQFAPLLPRFYSVASSLKTQKDSVDLLVALLSFTQAGEKRFGVASHFLCHLAEERKTPIPIYVQPAHRFGLPEDLHAPIIMIGPGTGVAPFRAFLQERIHLGSNGKHWLFFGERNRQFDFFYENYWSDLVAKNRLQLDLAFSRDQDEKFYVQHKMHENKSTLWRWLEEGAYLYVCGDADSMAKQVDAMLHTIVESEGNMNGDHAKAYVKKLRQDKRYLLDVY
ncbi:MAG TPA: sulfite reductase [Rhabdochlamydiaceae bacterium]|nr:sulfite reductase [Rhabdochlamydiaceae bacterium]